MIQSKLAEQRNVLNSLSQHVIGMCIDVHRELGPGVLESAYEECLAYELRVAGLSFQRQIAMPIRYKEVVLDCGYRLDLIIENSLIIELKAVAQLLPLHDAQLLSYLRLTGLPLGLLINFHVPALKDGIKRMANGSLFI
jgi:GxxExxY protein